MQRKRVLIAWAPFIAIALLELLLLALGAQLPATAAEAILRMPALPLVGTPRLVIPAGLFLLVFGATWALGLLLMALLPHGTRFRHAAGAVLILGAAARLAVLAHPASDDLNRYLWEGRLLTHGMSPYAHAPVAANDPQADFLRDPADPIWRGINHPRMTAIYPPLDLLVFALISSVSYSPGAVKGVLLVVDLATLVLLLALLRERHLDARWALLHALQPVVVYAFAGAGHLDALQNLAIVALLYAHSRRRWGWFFLCAGLAAQVKYIAFLAWPLLINRRNWRQAWITPVTLILPLLPFIYLDGGDLFRSLLAFGSDFSFNGSLHALLRWSSGSHQLANLGSRVLFVLILGVGHQVLNRRAPNSSTDADPAAVLLLLFGAFLLCAPTVHWWYLTWVTPLLVLRPNRSWFLLLGTIGATFIAPGTRAQTGVWMLPVWAQWAVWGLPLPLIMLHAWRAIHYTRPAATAPRNFAVVIPALNEERRLRTCIEALRADPVVSEIIVVDGGSSDATATIAGDLGATVLHHPAPPSAGGGRGGQIEAGCRVATADLVAIVHADVRVPPGALARAQQALAAQPDAIGGALGAVFNGRALRYRLLEIGNDLRAIFGGITFGDQVQFFRREPVVDGGRIPAIPLMEDVELALRLNRMGRTLFLFERVAVSTRRWHRNAAIKSILVMRLTLRYLIERGLGCADPLRMYHRYYGKP